MHQSEVALRKQMAVKDSDEEDEDDD